MNKIDWKQVNRETRHAIYDILVEECGAPESLRDNFIWHQGMSEYRFVGALDQGGKFWNDNGRWYVSCYREHKTPERIGMIERANARLADLLVTSTEGQPR